jgi:UDP-2-acetamido-2,6-beta-L-arabino-hexul-4-ose reductase
LRKIKVGITGQAGFIGTHLFNYFGIQSESIERIPFEDSYFENRDLFDDFLKKCDVVVHLAALNRHNDPQIIYNKNLDLVETLIASLEKLNLKPHVILSSSTQETLDNPYGKSKYKCRELLIEWAKRNNANFTGLVIPNVFGPFGKPYYNSVISTFSYQITHGLKPKIEVDNNIKLIYVNNLIEEIYKIIIDKITADEYRINHDFEQKVTNILEKLNNYYTLYYEKYTIPNLSDINEVAIFNTFRSYFDYDIILRELELKTDERGYLSEIIKAQTAGQSFFSSTKPGIVRGNHFHLRKIERFGVIKGEAIIRLRKIGTSDIIEYKVSGNKPSYIDIPIWHTHNIQNIGNTELLTFFWANEIFNPNNADTYYEEV